MSNLPQSKEVAVAAAILMPEILDTRDLARWLRCSESTARTYLRQGRVPGRRLGHRWLVSREALLRVLVTDRRLLRLRVVDGSEGGGR